MKASYEVAKDFRGKEWICYFKVDGKADFDCRGTDGLGLKLYSTKEKAIAAGKRYLKKMQKNGFTI